MIMNHNRVLTSVFLLAATLGVSSDSNYDYRFYPMTTRSQERRICAHLCLSGLGGSPCGEYCKDLVPQDLPFQFASERHKDKVHNDTNQSNILTRSDVCPVLCENFLGQPLCKCDKNDSADANFKVDFQNICSQYCSKYNYQLSGCRDCKQYELLKNASKTLTDSKSPFLSQLSEIDWASWCTNKCGEGQGGAACNCDLLPMSIQKH